MSFYDWLHNTKKPMLKINLENIDEYIIEEIGMSRKELQRVLDELVRYGVIRFEYEYK